MDEKVLSLFNQVLDLTEKQKKQLMEALNKCDSFENPIFRMDYIASFNKKLNSTEKL